MAFAINHHIYEQTITNMWKETVQSLTSTQRGTQHRKTEENLNSALLSTCVADHFLQ